jgi:DNA-binding transcriptional LysR family regulator
VGRAKLDHRLAPETELAAFASQPFVRIYQRSTLFGLTEPLFQAAGFVPKTLFSTASNMSKYRIVALGLGCALLPATYCVRGDEVVYFRLPQRPKWQITLCSRKKAFLGHAETCYLTLCRHYWQERISQ